MRELFVFLAFIFFHGTEAQSQNKFGFEVNSGISYSIPYQKEVSIIITDVDVDGGTNTKYSSNQDYFIGLLINYNLNAKQSFSIGLSYLKYSVNVNDFQLFIEQKGRLETSYLNIPFLFNQRYSDSSIFSISCGPYVGILLESNESGISYTDDALLLANPNDPHFVAEREYNHDISNDYHPTDFGLLVQQNIELRINKFVCINLFARFNLGLVNVIASDIFERDAEYSAAEMWYNNYYSFGVGIKF